MLVEYCALTPTPENRKRDENNEFKMNCKIRGALLEVNFPTVFFTGPLREELGTGLSAYCGPALPAPAARRGNRGLERSAEERHKRGACGRQWEGCST